MQQYTDVNKDELCATYLMPKYICKELHNGHIRGDADKITDSPVSGVSLWFIINFLLFYIGIYTLM